MSKPKIRLVVVLVTFLLGIAAITVFLFKDKNMAQQPDVAISGREAQGLRLIIPNASWEVFFFKALDEHIKQVNLPRLRTVVLPKNDLEVRFWYDRLPNDIDGVVLRRTSDQWFAIHLYGRYKHPHFQMQQETLSAPKSGWEAVWGKLANAEILTLPDASEVQCHSEALDGLGYVMETNVNKTYRTYRYGNPQLMKCNEAKQMIAIGEIISYEFGLERTPD